MASAYRMLSVSVFATARKLRGLPWKSTVPRACIAKDFPVRVPISIDVRRESVPSNNYMANLADTQSNSVIAIYADNLPRLQWFERSAVYKEVLAQAYEYSEPKLGMSRWPVLSETANSLLFNIVEGEGGGQVSTVPAKVSLLATVDSIPSLREAVIVERMDDGQWRVAGYGTSGSEGFVDLQLEVTTSGIRYAIGLDDFGFQFVPGLPVTIGQRVRPSQYTGWVYQITEPGALPGAEPLWWAADGENASRPLGTARAIAVRFHRPLAHGPIPVELI